MIRAPGAMRAGSPDPPVESPGPAWTPPDSSPASEAGGPVARTARIRTAAYISCPLSLFVDEVSTEGN